jgi:hypothetical protein
VYLGCDFAILISFSCEHEVSTKAGQVQSSTSVGTASNWDRAEFPNVLDYHAAILDLSTLPSESVRLTSDVIADLRNKLSRLLANRGTILVLVPFSIPKVSIGQLSGRRIAIPLENFLPVKSSAAVEGGEAINLVDQGYDWYVTRLRRWSFHLALAGAIEIGTQSVAGTFYRIAANLEGKAIAGELRFPNGGRLIALQVTDDSQGELVACTN